MTDEATTAPASDEAGQNAVNLMTVKLARAEVDTQKALVSVAALVPAIAEFRKAIGTNIAYTAVAQSIKDAFLAGEQMSIALQSIGDCHSTLDAWRQDKKLGVPTLVALDGSGGGKP